MVKLVILSFFCVISHALASQGDPLQFKGKWSGTGVYKLEGNQYHCKTFTMEFDGSRYLMNFSGGSRVCESHTEKFAPVAMAFNNGKLLFNGKDVGFIESNRLVSYFSMPEGNGRIRHWRMSMRVEGDTMVYEESRRMDNEATPMISFAGLLNRVE